MESLGSYKGTIVGTFLNMAKNSRVPDKHDFRTTLSQPTTATKSQCDWVSY